MEVDGDVLGGSGDESSLLGGSDEGLESLDPLDGDVTVGGKIEV